MANVVLERVAKRYPNGFQAIHELDLTIADKEIVVLVGPSGCGKSTALRMIAGLEDVSGGEVRIGGEVVNDVPPKDRDIAMVFQNYALYPHMTVYENIGFALKVAKTPKAEASARIREIATMLELTESLDSKPAQLSGGQRQRVAMGRALVRKPEVFLMDEPLSNLDAKLRVQMRAEIARLQRELAVTTVYVTHDQVEAMTMGDRVAVLKDGYLQQIDPPQTLYERPANVFVGAFIGSPAMNLYEATLDGSTVSIGSHSLTIPAVVLDARPDLAQYNQRTLIVGIRPEDLEDGEVAGHRVDDGTTLTGTVTLVEALGSELVVHLGIDAPRIDAGDPEAVEPASTNSSAVGRFDSQSQATVGDVVTVVVDVAKLHFFDAQTRVSIFGPT